MRVQLGRFNLNYASKLGLCSHGSVGRFWGWLNRPLQVHGSSV